MLPCRVAERVSGMAMMPRHVLRRGEVYCCLWCAGGFGGRALSAPHSAWVQRRVSALPFGLVYRFPDPALVSKQNPRCHPQRVSTPPPRSASQSRLGAAAGRHPCPNPRQESGDPTIGCSVLPGFPAADQPRDATPQAASIGGGREPEAPLTGDDPVTSRGRLRGSHQPGRGAQPHPTTTGCIDQTIKPDRAANVKLDISSRVRRSSMSSVVLHESKRRGGPTGAAPSPHITHRF